MFVLHKAVPACLVTIATALAIAPVHAAVVVPVPAAPNSSLTTVFAINDNNTIAGSYVGSGDGIEHSFFGTLDGDYTSFDAGSGGSEARGISNKGIITGFSNSQHGTTADEPIFERLANGKVLNVERAGQQIFGLAQQINSVGKFAGYLWNFQNHQTEGFLGKKGKWVSSIDIPAVHQFAGGLGINDSNTVVGYYFTPPFHGYVLSGKTLTTIDYPGKKATATMLESINNNGQIAGQWVDAESNQHSFMLDLASGTFTDIKIKGAHSVRAWAINSAGAVAVSSDIGSFIWCAKKSACPKGGSEVGAPVHVAAKAFTHALVQ